MRLEALQPSRLRHGLGNDGRFLEETCRFSMGFSISSVCLRSDASSTNVFFSLIIIFTRDNVWAWDDLPHKSFQCGHSCYSSHRFSIHDLPYQSWFVFYARFTNHPFARCEARDRLLDSSQWFQNDNNKNTVGKLEKKHEITVKHITNM